MSKIPHPTVSDFLRDELMEPLGLTQTAVAKAAGIPLARLNQILLGKRPISAETDLRLCRLFGMSDGHFLPWQTSQEIAQAKDQLGAKLNRVKPLVAA
jgi:addiction module HigA family antidote